MPENAQLSCIPIKRMLRESIRLGCAIGALQLESRAPWVGYTVFADCAHDMSDEQTSARRFSHLPARSSVRVCPTVFSGALNAESAHLRSPPAHCPSASSAFLAS